MVRQDMFDWLLRKKRGVEKGPETVPQKVASEPGAAEPSAPVVPEISPASELSEAVELAAAVTVPRPAEPVVEVSQAPANEPPYESPAEASSPDDVAAEPLEPKPVEAEPLAEAPVAAAPEPVIEPVIEAAPAPAPQPALQRAPFAAGQSRPKPLQVLAGSAQEIDLRAGVPVVEQHGRRNRPGVLVAVRADGRRLLVSLESVGQVRAYSLRPDGVYRLEGASDARAPVLRLVPEVRSTLH